MVAPENRQSQTDGYTEKKAETLTDEDTSSNVIASFRRSRHGFDDRLQMNADIVQFRYLNRAEIRLVSRLLTFVTDQNDERRVEKRSVDHRVDVLLA